MFWFNSDDDRDDKKPPEEKEEVIQEGKVGDAPIAGLRYESGSLTGITDSSGSFQYESGKNVRLFLGDLPLGESVPGNARITLPELIPGSGYATPAIINMTRLLLSLDITPDDDSITIPPSVRRAARLDNELVATSIMYMDFSRETDFVNSASHLVAVLTYEYAFTTSLVDAESAKDYLQKSRGVD